MHALALLPLILTQILALTINEEYEQCKDEADFGTTTLVCDVEQRLTNKTVAKLTHLLRELQDKIKCTCPGGCLREDGRDGYLGLLMVTDSRNTKSISQEAKKIYRDAKLGNASCEHGLLLVYLKDTAQLATYRGGDSFVLMNNEDMAKLHELALKGAEGGSDAIALQYLLQNYKDAVDPKVQRAESWMPVLGLIAAILIVLIIMAVLMAMFMAKFCCCCNRNKKEVYHVNTIPTYKTIEPLYVVTPPSGSERYPHSDAIYSTPYSGSPLPYPPPPGTSRPITPSSTFRTRIYPASIADTPASLKSQKRKDRGEYAEKKEHEMPLKNETSKPTTPKVPIQSDRGEFTEKKNTSPTQSRPDESVYAFPPENIYSTNTLPTNRDSYMPSPHESYGTIPRPIVSRDLRDGNLRRSILTESDLSFLDPHRKQETQTREDFIY